MRAGLRQRPTHPRDEGRSVVIRLQRRSLATAGYAWDGDRDVLEMVLLFCCSMGLFSFFFFFFSI